jgi:hypothetical protein
MRAGRRNRNVVNDGAVLASELAGVRKGTKVVFEAAYGSGWSSELVSEPGSEPHLAHTSRCRAIADAKLKYDKLDARTLANLLRTADVAEAWLAPQDVRERRLLLRERAWLVRLRTDGQQPRARPRADEGIAAPRYGLWGRCGLRMAGLGRAFLKTGSPISTGGTMSAPLRGR